MLNKIIEPDIPIDIVSLIKNYTMIKKILIALLVLILIYLAICPLGPKNMNAETIKTVKLSPEQAYSYFSDFKTWPKWSIWISEDPEIKLTFQEPSAGLGASYSWISKKSGNGRMRIVNVKPNESIDYELNFEGMGITQSMVSLKPVTEGTEIRWRLYSADPFPFVLRGMFWLMNMNQRIADDFNKGIDNMVKLANQG